MDTNWKHQKKAIATDQKNRTDDEHVHEREKRHLEVSKKAARPAQQQPDSGAEKAGEDLELRRERE